MPYPETVSSPLYEEYWDFLRILRLFLRGKLDSTVERHGIFFFTLTA